MAALISTSHGCLVRVLVTGVSDSIGGAIGRRVANVPNSAIAMCVREQRPEVDALAAELQRRGCRTLVLEDASAPESAGA